VAKVAVQVFYNTRTYRWEIWRPGDRLPVRTHPSKDQAVLEALSLVREARRGELLVYSDDGSPETLVQARGISPLSRRAVQRG
jgi:hypothetical protein